MRSVVFILLLIAGANVATSQELTATKRVVQLLTELMDTIKREGEEEAVTYDKFACFCKRLTSAKNGEIQQGSNRKDGLAATINSEVTQRGVADQGITDANSAMASMMGEMETINANHKTESLAHDATDLDLVQAITNVDSAIQILKATRTANALNLAQVQPVAETVRKVFALAEKMGEDLTVPEGNEKVVTALLSVGQEPDEDLTKLDYEFKSNDIIATLENLKREFSTKKYEVDTTWLEIHQAYSRLIQDKGQQMRSTQKAMDTHSTNKATLTKQISSDEYDYSATAAELAEDVMFLDQLTRKCSEKAVLWDQRTLLRTNELQALQSALETMQSLEQSATQTASLSQVVARKLPVSFLQIPVEAHVQEKPQAKLDLSRRTRVLSILKMSAAKLHSVTLLKAAAHVSEDPFAKVKGLLQSLLEGLTQASEQEQDHATWCAQEMATANQARDDRVEAIEKVNSDLAFSEARRGELAREIAQLDADLDDLEKTLTDESAMRSKEEAENAAALKEAREGRDAVQMAIDMLEKFYKEAKNSSVDFDAYRIANTPAPAPAAFIQLAAGQTPEATNTSAPAGVQQVIDMDQFEDVPETHFDGVYVGKQSEGTGIINMLGVVFHDLEKTVTDIEFSEESSDLEYQELEKKTEVLTRAKTSARGARNTAKFDLDQQDEANRGKLKEDAAALDKILEEMAELNKSCGSGGMTYADRKKKREEEVEALEKAMCILSARESGKIEAC